MESEGFLLQIKKDQYLLGTGPFIKSKEPHPNKTNLFVCDFFSCFSNDWLIPSYTSVYSKSQLYHLLKTHLLKKTENPIKIADWKWIPPSFSEFETVFHTFKKKIRDQSLQKIVPVFFEKARIPSRWFDIKALLFRLINNVHNSWDYAFWSLEKAFIGSSPEILFQKTKTHLKTMALAGTSRYPTQNLLTDPKERQEHQWVVKDIKTAVKTLGNCIISNTYVYSIGALQHLRTDFTIELKEKNIDFKKLCRILHPTAALGGTPRKQALQILKNLQDKNPRYYFGSPFGILRKGESFCIVAIRNIQFIKRKAFLGSGCGLVEKSQLNHEWQELKRKRDFIKNILF